jgi:glycosyltransferase involved in cell wall biosynthesis
MVKILHVINTLAPAGAQTLLMNFAVNFKDPDFQIYIAYIYGQGELLKEYQLDNNVEVFNLTRNGKFDYFSLFKLIAIIKTRKIDIVHTHLLHAGILGKMAAKICGVRHIVTTRHYGFDPKEKRLLHQIENFLTKSSSVVIAISDAVKKYLLSQNIVADEKIVVIPNGIDLKKIDLQKNGRIGRKINTNWIIGSVGRLVPQKDFVTLLDCLHLVAQEFPNIKLEIIGDGVLRSELESYAASLNIKKHLEFTGGLPHGEVLNKMNGWDLFILSSAWEGFGIALIEAMALEKAVVATNIEGITEIVDDGLTGYLVPAKSPRDLAKRVIELLSNEGKRIIMGKQGREKVIDRFSIEKFNDRTKEVYESLIA